MLAAVRSANCDRFADSLMGGFSRFTEVVGETPTAYRSRQHDAVNAMPSCVAKTVTRPIRNTSSRIGEATGVGAV